MTKLLWVLSLFVLGGISLFGQTTSLTGTVTDPTGAVIPNASIALLNVETGASRDTVSDGQGRYSLPQLIPGTYRLTAKATGFSDVVIDKIELLVNQPATIPITFEKVGSTATTVQVEATAAQVNTVDASLGNAVGGMVITQLPFEARNVVGLLSLQPGVVFLGEPNPGTLNDYRSGAVNGGKSDQANVTLDGVDVNDQQDRSAFTSVLRVTLDSVEEFRTVTTNGGADAGRSSGPQVTLVTKSGTNTLHGSAYEFLRNTLTSANTFFNNAAGVPRQKLNRNVFGVSLGGPIKKNRLFFFTNYEGRRDVSAGGAVRTVPNADFRQGLFKYVRKDGSIGTLTPADIKNTVDPLHIGEDPAVLTYLQQFPMPNDNTVGDGLNTAGFRFNASTPLRWNTYIAKIDYRIDDAGKHSIFWRGNLQNDNYANGLPQFPGQPPSSVFLENSKGYAVGYTAVLRPNLISNFRYGFTRQGVESTGVQTSPAATLRDLSTLFPLTTGLARILPVHTIAEDMSWTKGAHTISFGATVRLIDNRRAGNATSFSDASGNSSWLLGTGSSLLVADAKSATAYKRQMSNILGLLPELDHRVNYDLQGNVLPEGVVIKRDFEQKGYEMYVQDSWKATRGLTITAGLRYSLDPPIHETHGFQTTANTPLGDWLNLRGILAAAGLPQSLAPRISFDLSSRPGGRDLYPFHKDWAPRIAIAYSPKAASGLSKFFFGGPGLSSIRAGVGMFYDVLGQGLAREFDSRMLGFSTLLTNPATASALTAPRFTGLFNVPTNDPSFLPAPKGGFPQTAPDVFAITRAVDDTFKAPYTINMNFSAGREFKGGFFVQGSYVGRLSRRSLIGDDLAMPTNLKDLKSGMTYNDAAGQLSQYVLAGTPVANVPKIAYWENLWPAAAGKGLTATQAIYQHYLDTGGDYTTALTEIDGEATLDGKCQPACSIFGPYAIFSSQYGSLAGFRSAGKGDYHAMQWTIRKRFSQGYQFDFNYTWSKSIDLGSTRETGGSTSGQILNSYFPDQMRAVSDYDTTHVFSALAVVELPFGRGKKFLGNANAIVDNILGGWQLSGLFRNTSGFPTGVIDGVGWATNWNLESYAMQTGIVPPPQTSKNAPSALSKTKGGANIFSDPLLAFDAYDFTNAGLSGQRNGIRGDGYFGIDLGLGKRFRLFTVRDNPHTLQFRAEAFNVTNTVRFDVNSASLDITNQAKFGQYSNALTRPRVFQFSARYEF